MKGSVAVRDATAVCVVLASYGYPESPRTGDAIDGIADAEQRGALVFQAGVKQDGDHLVTNGGRVLATVGVAESLEAARDLAYAAAEDISFAGQHMRRDIAQTPSRT